jgi:hypothetical protein
MGRRLTHSRHVPPQATTDLWSRPLDAWVDPPAQIQLGGITLYAADEARLRRGIDRVSQAILTGISSHPSLDRKLLLSVTATLMGERLDQRVFDAVLGSQLRMGHLDRLPAISPSGSVFRILVAAERREQFDLHCRDVADWARRDGRVTIKAVRLRYFGDGWGAWSSAAHIVARLALIGAVRFIDRYSFAWPEGLEHALG